MIEIALAGKKHLAALGEGAVWQGSVRKDVGERGTAEDGSSSSGCAGAVEVSCGRHVSAVAGDAERFFACSPYVHHAPIA